MNLRIPAIRLDRATEENKAIPDPEGKVVEAEKVAQANVIKRREETAATRSLLNTAKLMESNPTLMRLKELEVLEKVTEKVDKLTVFGGLDGVLNDTIKINLKAE